MRTRKILTRVNAMARQGRYILRLECGHNISLYRADADALARADAGETFDCEHCPDPPPSDPRRTKTAQQLYKESYEPDLSGL